MLFQTFHNFDIPQQKEYKEKDADPFAGNISVGSRQHFSYVLFVNEVKNISIGITKQSIQKCVEG